MTAQANLNLNLRLDSRIPSTANLGAMPTHAPVISQIIELVDGTGVGQIDVIYAKNLTLTTGASIALDLTGVTKDSFGNNIVMTTLCGCVIINKGIDGAINTTNLTVGAGSNPFLGLFGVATGFATLRPGRILLEWCGEAGGLGTVVAGTGDTINITNDAGATNQFQVVLFGRSV